MSDERSTSNTFRLMAYLGRKDKVIPVLSIIILLLLTPMAIKNFLIGEHTLAFTIVLFAVVFFIDALALAKAEPLPIHENIVAAFAVFLVSISLYILDGLAIFWFYPVSIIITFVFPIPAAIVFNLVILAISGSFMFSHYELIDALRYVFSLLLTLVVVCTLLKHIDNLQALLEEESSKDALTGTLNRRQLDGFLGDALKHKLFNQLDSTLVMIDVDHFKKINDQFGHAKGDMVLISLAQKIKALIRDTDLLFRVGGEEFVLLLPGTSLEEAKSVASKIGGAIHSMEIIQNHPVTISIGLCPSDKELSQSTWLIYADKALYAAKERGRNRACFYNLNLDEIEASTQYEKSPGHCTHSQDNVSANK